MDLVQKYVNWTLFSAAESGPMLKNDGKSDVQKEKEKS